MVINKCKITIIATVICMAMALSACGEQVDTNSARIGYDTFLGTDWGMTEQEVLTALKLSERDRIEPAIPTQTSGDAFTVKMKQWGKEAEVTFVFSDTLWNIVDAGLIAVEVKVLDTNTDTFKSVKERIGKELELYGVKHTTKPIYYKPGYEDELEGIAYESAVTMDSIEDTEMNERATRLAADVKKGVGLHFEGIPLSEIRITASPASEGGDKLAHITVMYSGVMAAAVNSFA